MDANLFVELVEKWGFTSAIKATLKNMTSPPTSNAELVELSRWFNGLELSSQRMTERAVVRGAAHAIFGFLCIIDGARAIEPGPDKGHLELFYVKGKTRVLLNDPSEEPLNDKFQGQWPETVTEPG
jgi:hypothetical protein